MSFAFFWSLLWFEDLAGGGHHLPLLLLSAHPLALALALTSPLLRSLYPHSGLALMTLLPGMGGYARVRIEDWQV